VLAAQPREGNLWGRQVVLHCVTPYSSLPTLLPKFPQITGESTNVRQLMARLS
jgi:hypothetical protein